MKMKEKLFVRSSSQADIPTNTDVAQQYQCNGKKKMMNAIIQSINKVSTLSPLLNRQSSSSLQMSPPLLKKKNSSIEKKPQDKSPESKKRQMVKMPDPLLTVGVEPIRVILKAKYISFTKASIGGGQQKTLEYLDQKAVVFREKPAEVNASNLSSFLKKHITFEPNQVHFFDLILREQDTFEQIVMNQFRWNIRRVLQGISYSLVIYGGQSSGKTQIAIGGPKNPGALMLLLRELLLLREELIDKSGGNEEEIQIIITMFTCNKNNQFFDSLISHGTPLIVHEDAFGNPSLKGLCEVKIKDSVDAMRILKSGFLNIARYDQDLDRSKQKFKDVSIVFEAKCIILNRNSDNTINGSKTVSSLRIVKLSEQSPNILKTLQEMYGSLAEANLKGKQAKRDLQYRNILLNYLNGSLYGNSLTCFFGCVSPLQIQANDSKELIDLMENVKLVKTNPQTIIQPSSQAQQNSKQESIENIIKFIDLWITEFSDDESFSSQQTSRLNKIGRILQNLKFTIEQVLEEYNAEAIITEQLDTLYYQSLSNTTKAYVDKLNSIHIKEFYLSKLSQSHVDAIMDYNLTQSRTICKLLSNLYDQMVKILIQKSQQSSIQNQEIVGNQEKELEQQLKLQELRSANPGFLSKSDISQLVNLSKSFSKLIQIYKEDKALKVFDGADAFLKISVVFHKIDEFNQIANIQASGSHPLKRRQISPARAAADLLWRSRQKLQSMEEGVRTLPQSIEVREKIEKSIINENEVFNQSSYYDDNDQYQNQKEGEQQADDSEWNELPNYQDKYIKEKLREYSKQTSSQREINLDESEEGQEHSKFNQSSLEDEDKNEIYTRIKVRKQGDSITKKKYCQSSRSIEDLTQSGRYIYVNNTRIDLKNKNMQNYHGQWKYLPENSQGDITKSIILSKQVEKQDEGRQSARGNTNTENDLQNNPLNVLKGLKLPKFSQSDIKKREEHDSLYLMQNEQLYATNRNALHSGTTKYRVAVEKAIKDGGWPLKIDYFLNTNAKQKNSSHNYPAPTSVYFHVPNSKSDMGGDISNAAKYALQISRESSMAQSQQQQNASSSNYDQRNSSEELHYNQNQTTPEDFIHRDNNNNHNNNQEGQNEQMKCSHVPSWLFKPKLLTSIKGNQELATFAKKMTGSSTQNVANSKYISQISNSQNLYPPNLALNQLNNPNGISPSKSQPGTQYMDSQFGEGLNQSSLKSIPSFRKDSSLIRDISQVIQKEQILKDNVLQQEEQSPKLDPQRQLLEKIQKLNSQRSLLLAKHRETSEEGPLVSTKQLLLNEKMNNYSPSLLLLTPMKEEQEKIEVRVNEIKKLKLKRERFVNSIYSIKQMELKLAQSAFSGYTNSNKVPTSTSNLSLPRNSSKPQASKQSNRQDSQVKEQKEENDIVTSQRDLRTSLKTPQKSETQQPHLQFSEKKWVKDKSSNVFDLSPIAHNINNSSRIHKKPSDGNNSQRGQNLNQAKEFYKDINKFKLEESPGRKKEGEQEENKETDAQKKAIQKQLIQFQIPRFSDLLQDRSQYQKFLQRKE